MNEVSLILRSINDFFSKKMLKIAFIPLLVVILFMYLLFFTAADYGFDSLHVVLEQAQNQDEIVFDDATPFYFIWFFYLAAFLFKYSITSWLVGFLFYTIGSFFILISSVFLSLIIVGFLSPWILKILHKKYYSHIKISEYGSILSPLYVLFKSSLIMIFLFILFIPLYFIPVLNIVFFNIPFYYLFHKLLNYDVSSTILSKEQQKIIYNKKASSFRLRTLFLYFISMIPFITIFSAVFYIIYLGHAYFRELEILQKEEKKNILIKK